MALGSLCLACQQQLVVTGILIDKPQLSVRDFTDVTVEATSYRPGATITYEPFANRGRIVHPNNREKTFRYFAPYTSRFPDQTGALTSGDKITIRVSDNFTPVSITQNVILSGNSLIFKGDATGCESDSSSDCNGPLFAGTVDESGLSIRDIRPLRDSLKRPLFGTQPIVSPDGRRIAWVVWPEGGSSGLPRPVNSTAIWTMDAGGVVQQVAGGSTDSGFNVDPSWSPLGNEIVFASNRGDNFDVFTVPAEQQGLAAVRLTANAADERYPAWNPNPQQRTTVAVSVHANSARDLSRADARAAWNVMLLDARTGAYSKQLTQLSELGPNGPDFAFETRWRSDGQWIAFTQRGTIGNNTSNAARFQRVFYQDINTSAGSGQFLNPSEKGGPLTGESNPTWSPNGQEIAYLKLDLDDRGNPRSSELFKGTPNLSKVGSGPVGSVGPQQWQQVESPISALHLLSTSARPVGGWSLDWR